MINGSCLCGSIKYEIDQEKVFMMSNCHCTNCRKVSGADYGTFIQVPPDAFNWLQGEELISTFESSPGNYRAFCKHCGSRMPQSNAHWPFVTIPAGSLDADPGRAPQANSFTASGAPWHQLDESIPSVPDGGSEEFWKSIIAGQQA